MSYQPNDGTKGFFGGILLAVMLVVIMAGLAAFCIAANSGVQGQELRCHFQP